jgi:hypothetical protein
VVTTNYDNLIESAYAATGDGAPPVFTHADYPELSAFLKSGSLYILKAHGTIDRSSTIILGRQDYRGISHANAAYRKHLESILLNRTVLFLGFSVTDPDLILIMEELASAFGATLGSLHALVSEIGLSTFRRKRLERDFGFQFHLYTPSSPAHPEVAQYLRQLGAAAREQNSLLHVGPSAQNPLEEFTREVRSWLQVLRYSVEEPKFNNYRCVTMTAVLQEGMVRQRILVHCLGGEVTPKDVIEMDRLINVITPQGWIIADRRISPRAHEVTKDHLRLMTFSGFLKKVVWANYISSLDAEADRVHLEELYVQPNAHKLQLDDSGRYEVGRDFLGNLEAYIEYWLPERGKSHISVLGDFGCGKTWFARHFAMKQLKRFLDNPSRERFPLLITLRAFAKAMTVQQLLNDVFYEQFKLPFLGSAYEIFTELNRRGKVLLILDGFDEMARQVDYQTVVDNFWDSRSLLLTKARLF